MAEPVIVGDATLYLGDCLEVLRGLPDASVDAVVTDPPYGLAFMGKRWDYDVPGVALWAEALRVLKPGGHLLSFGGARTYHRMAVAVEDAGFDIRDQIMWLYGSGFPKSMDVGKALDKAAGEVRQVIGKAQGRAATPRRDIRGGKMHACSDGKIHGYDGSDITAPATEAARQWDGWGTALKPAHEPIILARKPFRGSVAGNVLRFGVGAINVDGCRVRFASDGDKAAAAAAAAQRASQDQNKGRTAYGQFNNGPASLAPYLEGMDRGRFPANLIHDGSAEVVALFPDTASNSKPGCVRRTKVHRSGSMAGSLGEKDGDLNAFYGDSGSAARFFYCAKASKGDREAGLREAGLREAVTGSLQGGGEGCADPVSARFTKVCRNTHPTVKPTALMRYLCRLVTPPGGIVLDPFAGSGSTGKAAQLEGFRFIGIEREPEYFDIARARIAHAATQRSATP